MGVDYRKQFTRLMAFLESQKFEYLDRVKSNGPSLCDLQMTNFLIIMEFIMNIICLQQLHWLPVSIKADDVTRVKISREDRDRILKHIFDWQDDLNISPPLNKAQLSNELPSWTQRRADLLVAAMAELDKVMNNPTLSSKTPKRTSLSLLQSVSLSSSSSSTSSTTSPTQSYIQVFEKNQSYKIRVLSR